MFFLLNNKPRIDREGKETERGLDRAQRISLGCCRSPGVDERASKQTRNGEKGGEEEEVH